MDKKKCPFCGVFCPSDDGCYCFLEEEENEDCLEQHVDGSDDETHNSRNVLNGPMDFFMEGFGNSNWDVQQPAEKKLKEDERIANASAEVSSVVDVSGCETATNSSVADAEAVSVAGPSGIPSQSHGKGKERHVCGFCGKVFSQKFNLTVHTRTHTGEKPFRCRLCDQRFTVKSTLTEHLRTHTGERPFECEVCGKKFAKKTNVTIHLRTHTGEKPYRCEFCGRGFAQRIDCKRHEERKHGRK